MGRLFVTADCHFGHKNIIEYCSRPFASTEEMDKVLIRNWNETVSDEDQIYVLGDFAFCGKDRLIEIGCQLQGRKTLQRGNHDTRSKEIYTAAGFEDIYKDSIILQENLVLSHYPPAVISISDFYFYLYGHVHNSEMYQTVTRRSACVSVERWDYRPVEIEEIKRIANQL